MKIPAKAFLEAARQRDRFAKVADAIGDKETAKEFRRRAREFRKIARGPLPEYEDQ